MMKYLPALRTRHNTDEEVVIYFSGMEYDEPYSMGIPADITTSLSHIRSMMVNQNYKFTNKRAKHKICYTI